ncbi:MAG TPA: efflux RND transporter periplasmic adaptor subunit [Steroidobacteraceae bacterium]|jgi:RND family efflux transporter MFP subunit|nr:efflux RND transporter periplasmic adaptor subunit [Steroidobacteraceae bacterium]
MRHSYLLLAAAPLAALLVSGCARNVAAQQQAAAPPPQVTVAAAVSRKVTGFDEFTGRFEAVERVEIRPRVSGYISSVNFTYGDEVRKGDVLFVIDPRPYVAERDRARAQLAQARSQLALAKSERERATKLLGQHAISQEEFDTRTAGNEQAQASVEAAQAALDSAALNLEFTRVTAPIAGRISRALVTSGNYVASGVTPLTTLVSLDPIYVTFDGDEQAYLRYSKLARANAHGGSQEVARNPVVVGLANESGYPHQGALVFIDNALDPATGTIHSRALLDNHERLFTPGLFARIRLLDSTQRDAVLVNDSAIGTDQTVRYVLVVGTGNKVEYRPVQLGPVIDGLRVVQSGLTAGETVVVNGLQRVRPGAQVQPHRVAMGEHAYGEGVRLLAGNSAAGEGEAHP